MTCTKKRFMTKQDAKEYARRKASDPTFEHRGHLSAYRCPHEECAFVGFWHLTSIGARSRGYARKNARRGGG